MGVGRLNIWVSDVADACGTWRGDGLATVLDCDGPLEWPCGRFMTPDGKWVPVPGGMYRNLPFKCGHLEVEVPPGCYWVIAGYVTPIPLPGHPGFIHFNYTTHVGITQVGCDQTACVKVYNPTLRLCWDWFRLGLRMLTLPKSPAPIDAGKVAQLEKLVDEVLHDVPRLPIEHVIEKVFDEQVESRRKGM